MDIGDLLDYSDNCRQLLRQTLAAHPNAFGAPFETLSAYKSVRQIVAHCIGAEERWIEMRIGGRALPAFYEARAAETVEGLWADWDAVRAGTRDFYERLETDSLKFRIAVHLPHRDFRAHLSLEQILFHILNHESHRRGQIIMALQRMGIDPPDFGYVFLCAPPV